MGGYFDYIFASYNLKKRINPGTYSPSLLFLLDPSPTPPPPPMCYYQILPKLSSDPPLSTPPSWPEVLIVLPT